MEALIVILSIALCSCVSYLVIKRRLIPWGGGVMLVLESGEMIPIDFSKFRHSLNTDDVIKGIFLPGAKEYNMPHVSFRTNLGVYYQHISEDGGVYIILNRTLCLSEYTILLDVSSAHPWAGKRNRGDDDCYYAYVDLILKDADILINVLCKTPLTKERFLFS